VLGFILLERMREYSERLSRSNERIDEFHDKMKTLDQEIRSDLSEKFQQKVDQGLQKLEDFANQHQWLKKVIDDEIPDKFSNIRAIAEKAVERILENDFDTAYELVRRVGESNASDVGYSASADDVEFFAFVTYYLIGDVDLTLKIHSKYASKLEYDPIFILSYVRFAAVASDKNLVLRWHEYFEEARQSILLFERVKFLRRLFPKTYQHRIAFLKLLIGHWAAHAVAAFRAAMLGDYAKVDIYKLALSSLDLPLKQDVSLAHVLAALELVSNRPLSAILMFETILKRRPLVASEVYVYISILTQHSLTLEQDALFSLVDRALIRAPVDKSIATLARKMINVG